RALTLCHLPSRTAFTIRTWSRRTVQWTFFKSMECQSTAVLEAAPAGVATADISATPPWVGWPRFSRDGTLEGSQPAMSPSTASCSLASLRVEEMLLVGPAHLLSLRFPQGLRFLPHPCP